MHAHHGYWALLRQPPPHSSRTTGHQSKGRMTRAVPGRPAPSQRLGAMLRFELFWQTALTKGWDLPAERMSSLSCT
jgi:hypothetical protein